MTDFVAAQDKVAAIRAKYEAILNNGRAQAVETLTRIEAERRVVEAAKAHIRFLSAENGASSSETEGALWDTIIALAALKEARGDA